MPVSAIELEQLIKKALPGAEVQVSDLAGDQDHYAVYVEHEAFEGLSRVQQHRLVYDSLGDMVKGSLHALALQTQARSSKN